MAQSFTLNVIAEGVETKELRILLGISQLLRNAGKFLQQALPADELGKFLDNR